MRPLYIFDLDGTLALIDHRRHFVEGDKKDWTSFHKACVFDLPNKPVINTLKALRVSGATIGIWSGRSKEVEGETIEWLRWNRCLGGDEYPYWLRMREVGDHQPDVKLKYGWLMDLGSVDRARLVAVFDDRKRLVDMWRANGVTCFQVAPGEF